MSFHSFINTENAAVEFEHLSREQQLEISSLYDATERAVNRIAALDQSIAPTIYRIAKKTVELCGDEEIGGPLPAIVREIMMLHDENHPVLALMNAIDAILIPPDGRLISEYDYADQRQHWLHVLFDASRRKGNSAGFCLMATKKLEHVPLRAPAW